MSVNFYYFRTFSGEWVCGDLKSDTDEGFILNRPRVLQYISVGENQIALQFMPYDLTNPEGEVLFHPECAMSHVQNPSQELMDKYKKITGT